MEESSRMWQNHIKAKLLILLPIPSPSLSFPPLIPHMTRTLLTSQIPSLLSPLRAPLLDSKICLIFFCDGTRTLSLNLASKACLYSLPYSSTSMWVMKWKSSALLSSPAIDWYSLRWFSTFQSLVIFRRAPRTTPTRCWEEFHQPLSSKNWLGELGKGFFFLGWYVPFLDQRRTE